MFGTHERDLSVDELNQPKQSSIAYGIMVSRTVSIWHLIDAKEEGCVLTILSNIGRLRFFFSFSAVNSHIFPQNMPVSFEFIYIFFATESRSTGVTERQVPVMMYFFLISTGLSFPVFEPTPSCWEYGHFAIKNPIQRTSSKRNGWIWYPGWSIVLLQGECFLPHIWSQKRSRQAPYLPNTLHYRVPEETPKVFKQKFSSEWDVHLGNIQIWHSWWAWFPP